MTAEVKVLIDNAGYHTLSQALGCLFIKEEIYQDYFFDFPSGSLSDHHSILRLRVPRPTAASPVMPTHTESHHSDYQSFMQSCDGPNIVDVQLQKQQQQFSRAFPLAAADPSSGAGGGGGGGVGSQPRGCLVLKERLTVTAGSQMPGRREVRDVPEEVIEQLITSGSDAYAVLDRWAKSAPQSPVVDLLARLQSLHAEQAVVHAPAGGAATTDSAVYSQIRYSAGAARDENNNNNNNNDRDSVELVLTGGYSTIRKVHKYISGANDQAVAEPWRESIRIRLDHTLYGFDERFEVEISNISYDYDIDAITNEVRQFLEAHGVRYEFGNESKYTTFLRHMRNQGGSPRHVNDVKLRLLNVNAFEEVRLNAQALFSRAAALHDERRGISTTDLPKNTSQDCMSELDNTEEQQLEDIFFDSSEARGALSEKGAFLRLRRSIVKNEVTFSLVLKSAQDIVHGQQKNTTYSITLSEADAQALATQPDSFLFSPCHRIAQTLREEYNVQHLEQTHRWSTCRLKLKWSTARSQPRADNPLVIHLDCTRYEIPQLKNLYTEGITHLADPQDYTLIHPIYTSPQSSPFLQMYELEVSNIAAGSSPEAVHQELTALLDSRGVMWRNGENSKLDLCRLLHQQAASADRH